METPKTDFPTFESAYTLLTRSAARAISTITANPVELAKVCEILQTIKDKGGRIHCIGKGSSNETVRVIGEGFKDLGFEVSFLADMTAKQVIPDDLVLAVTGSGWTNYTTLAIEDAIRRKAKVLTITGNSYSKAAKMSEVALILPYFGPQDYVHGFQDKRPPLTPLGSIFELTAIVVGVGIINGLYTGSCTRGFEDGGKKLIDAAKKTLTELKALDLNEFIKILLSYSNGIDSNIFLAGTGISGIIGKLIELRLQQLGANVQPIENWRFRNKNDLLIAISGSGNNTIVINKVDSALDQGMKVISITSFSDSILANKSHHNLIIRGRLDNQDPSNINVKKGSVYYPSFEYSTSIAFEAIIAHLAVELGLQGEGFQLPEY